MSKKITRGFKPQKTLAALAVGTALMISMPAAIAADKTSGSVKGHIVIESGSTLSNVQVTLKHLSKGLTRTTMTDEKGNFDVKALPIGKYTVTFSKDGYETIEEKAVEVKAGSSASYNISMFEQGIERISVTGSSVQMVDFESSTTQLVLTADDLARLPVGQDLTSVALLAPSSSLAADPDKDYGRGASFNGSSVAENGYFLNGLNITDIRKGLGNIDLPWEAIAQTNIVTGGVSAEYGQFIGGVTDLVSKSGDNEFKFGVVVDYIPGSLSSQSPDTWGYSTISESDGSFLYAPELKDNNRANEFTKTRYNLYASGAIIEDTLFFYGIFNPQKVTNDYANETNTFTRDTDTADYWLAKVDWFITDEHNIGFTALNNEWERSRKQDNTYDYDRNSGDGTFNTPEKSSWGGSMWSVNYSGILTDEVTISAIYGVTKQTSDSINPTSNLSPIWDERSGNSERMGDWVGLYGQDLSEDQRTQFRVDLDWEIGDHTIRFGYSEEVIETNDNLSYAGDGKQYRYRVMSQGTLDWINDNRAWDGLAPFTGISAGDDYYRAREYSVIGKTEAKNTAIYIQDTWNVTDEVTLNLGIRNSSFSSETGAGDTYADMDNQWAPRLGAIWDVNGEGTTKVTVNYGRYFMPISPNTNVRMTLGEMNQYNYHTFDSIGSDNLPVGGETMYLLNYGDGNMTQPYQTLVDAELDPMYSDEYSVGITHELNENWIVGARYIYQDLISSIEDTNMKFVLDKWSTENPGEAAKLDPNWDTSSSWVGFVLNPGSSARLAYDQNQDGVIGKNEGVTWSSDYIGLPKAERTYQAIEFTLEGKPSENSTLQASYSYSRSEGNTEGLVSGSHSQADPGWSGSFDSPEVVDNSYGRTSNDIPHKFKVFGAYDITDNLNVGMVIFAQEGRARNALGYHPQDAGSCAPSLNITNCDSWDSETFYSNGQPSQRGSAGHGDWITSIDMSVNYSVELGDAGKVSLSAKVFNLLDSDTAASYNDMTEHDTVIGLMDPNYGNATSYQAPRSFLLTARYDF